MLLAKSNGTSLAQHSYNVWQCVRVLSQHNLADLPNEWWNDLEQAAVFHDLGKIDPAMQEVLNSRIRKSTFPHSLLSLLFFVGDKCSNSSSVMAAIAFHHWRDQFPEILLGLGSEGLSNLARLIAQEESKWDADLEELRLQLQEMQPDLDVSGIKINHDLLEYLQYNSLGDSGLLLPPYTMNFLPDYLKIINSEVRQKEKMRVFLTGSLMRADHFASLMEENHTLNYADIERGVTPPFAKIYSFLKDRFNGFWQGEFFNKRTCCDNDTGSTVQDLIFVGGTGVGKTELSYLWSAGHKTLMVLPIRAAVNKLWDRSRKLMAEVDPTASEIVGLLHGNASLDIRGRFEEKDYTDESIHAVTLARHLSNAFIVASADQLAPAALRYPGY